MIVIILKPKSINYIINFKNFMEILIKLVSR